MLLLCGHPIFHFIKVPNTHGKSHKKDECDIIEKRNIQSNTSNNKSTLFHL